MNFNNSRQQRPNSPRNIEILMYMYITDCLTEDVYDYLDMDKLSSTRDVRWIFNETLPLLILKFISKLFASFVTTIISDPSTIFCVPSSLSDTLKQQT
jgi:hypothetical protein